MRPRPDGRALRAGAALSPALLLLLPLLGRLWAAGSPAPSSAPGARQEGAQAGRVKRGWVWNQFFVVEEYTGTEPLYVGKVKWGPTPAGATEPAPGPPWSAPAAPLLSGSPAWAQPGHEAPFSTAPAPGSQPCPSVIQEEREQ